MKILYTGCTRNATYGWFNVPKRQAITSDHAFHDGMVALGHEVTRRFTKPGQNLDEFDLIVSSLVPLTWFGATKGGPGAYYAAGYGKPTIVTMSDFTLTDLKNNGQAMGTPEGWDGRLNSGFFDGLKHGRDSEWLPQAIAGCRMVGFGELKPGDKMLVPLFKWGNPGMLARKFRIPEADMLWADPSYHTTEKTEHAAPKAPPIRARAWIFPTVPNYWWWIKELGLKWPVTTFPKERRVTEQEVYTQHFEHSGALVFPYDHDGSGWWRNRYIYGTSSLTVMAGAPMDEILIGKSYEYTPRQIEAFTPSQREDLAAFQAEQVKPRLSSKEEFIEQIRGVLSHFE